MIKEYRLIFISRNGVCITYFYGLHIYLQQKGTQKHTQCIQRHQKAYQSTRINKKQHSRLTLCLANQ